jgi:uracil-DNA glycosylase
MAATMNGAKHGFGTQKNSGFSLLRRSNSPVRGPLRVFPCYHFSNRNRAYPRFFTEREEDEEDAYNA